MRPSRTTVARLLRVGAATAVLGGTSLIGMAAVGAEAIDDGSAAAYGAELTIAGTNAFTEPLVTQEGIGDNSATTIDIPASPVAVSGTLNGTAQVHEEADIDSSLQVFAQDLEGPYNAVGLGLVEGAAIITEEAGLGVTLLEVGVLRAEAVAACVDGETQYSANSEIVNLNLGGENLVEGTLPLNSVLNTLIDELNANLFDAGLDAVLDIDRNVVTELEDGIAVDALVVDVLSAIGDPLAHVVLGHAEVSGVSCAPVAPPTTPAPPVEGPPLTSLPTTGGTTDVVAGLGLLTLGAGFAAARRRVLG